MLKLSKKADYALIAVRHLAAPKQKLPASAHVIAYIYHIPISLMAKVLQKLHHAGLVRAAYGAGGGYFLALSPDKITVLDVISAIDGPLRITSCVTAKGPCLQSATCTVRDPLQWLNHMIADTLSRTTISEIAARAVFLPEGQVIPAASLSREVRKGAERWR